MINATKGLLKRKFDDHIWKEMPAHKYGWTIAAEEPDEVKQIREHKVTKEDIARNPELEGLEGKVVGIPVVESNNETEIMKIEHELKSGTLHHMVRKKLEKRLAELKGENATDNQ